MGGVERNVEQREALILQALDEIWFKLRDAAPFAAVVDHSQVRPEWESDCRLIAVTGGQGKLITGDRQIPLKSGMVYMSAPGEKLRVCADSAYRLEMYLFRFQALVPDAHEGAALQLPRRMADFPLLGEPTPYPASALISLCKTICVCRNSLDPLERFRGQAVFEDLLHRLFKESMSGTDQELDAALETVRTYIEQHYEKELTVKKLAEMSRISPRHLMRLFKENYGMTIGEYTKELKRAGKRPTNILARSSLGERYRMPDTASHRFG
ncbi:hypothetical protein CGZ75_18380 [Paenibacillus herberti]|uniref:HTH araC/xylS-type domain-containing protein n=1 Tax=Paenibacillus herberti TaxID=1619309 RepID=A0A229NXU2_9BACL|nr:hypothetical protein CGZ75_18380 [Paenibacillus herberti]